jgi:hypothetical protein
VHRRALRGAEELAPHVIERIGANGAHARVIEFVADGVHLDDKAQMMLAVELVLDGIGTRLPRE